MSSLFFSSNPKTYFDYLKLLRNYEVMRSHQDNKKLEKKRSTMR
jgi:hypothetical protein